MIELITMILIQSSYSAKLPRIEVEDLLRHSNIVAIVQVQNTQPRSGRTIVTRALQVIKPRPQNKGTQIEFVPRGVYPEGVGLTTKADGRLLVFLKRWAPSDLRILKMHRYADTARGLWKRRLSMLSLDHFGYGGFTITRRRGADFLALVQVRDGKGRLRLGGRHGTVLFPDRLRKHAISEGRTHLIPMSDLLKYLSSIEEIDKKRS